jgi:regulator of nucleoside diphosphate kinase
MINLKSERTRGAAFPHEPAIIVGKHDLERLRAVVESNLFGRDEEAAERLGAELDRAIVVPQDAVPPEIVTVGSRVVFEDADTGRTREVTLCEPRDADPSQGRVSILAPVGSALLGLGVGETIDWPLPNGRTGTFRIVAVERRMPPWS